MKNSLIIAGLVCSALVGCSSNMSTDPQLVAEPDPITIRLANAADRAANSLAKLAAIEQKRTPVNLPPIAPDAPSELQRTITLDWYGEPEPVVKKMADIAGYKFRTSGAKPTIPLVIRLNTRNQPIIEVMRDVGLQIEGRAIVKVDANTKIVEINY